MTTSGLFDVVARGRPARAPRVRRRRRSAGCSTRSTSCSTPSCCASLIEDPVAALSQSTAGILGSATLLAAARRRHRVRRRSRIDSGRKRALMAAVLIYSDLHRGVRLRAVGAAARHLPRPARHRHGRRMGDRRGARVGIVSRAASRQGARLRAERVGHRLRPRGAGQPDRDADLGMARRLLRRRAARRCSRCGSGATSKSRRCGSRRRRPSAAVSARSSSPGSRGTTVAIALMNSCCLFAWWGLNGWVPAYLRLSPAQGGIGLSSSTMSLVRDRDAGRHVVRLRDASGSWPTPSAANAPTSCIVLVRRRAAAALRVPAGSRGAAAARPVRGVLRHRLLQRPRARWSPSSIRRPCVRRPPASATTSDASRAPPRRTSVGSVAQSRGFGVAFAIAGAAFLAGGVRVDLDSGNAKSRADIEHVACFVPSCPCGCMRCSRRLERLPRGDAAAGLRRSVGHLQRDAARPMGKRRGRHAGGDRGAASGAPTRSRSPIARARASFRAISRRSARRPFSISRKCAGPIQGRFSCRSTASHGSRSRTTRSRSRCWITTGSSARWVARRAGPIEHRR